jgi:hypothetical protein
VHSPQQKLAAVVGLIRPLVLFKIAKFKGCGQFFFVQTEKESCHIQMLVQFVAKIFSSCAGWGMDRQLWYS